MPRRILIVDDDPQIRSLFARWLPPSEYRLAFCRKPLLAPAVAHRFRASLAIVDAHLGASVNGFQLCAILKQMRETRSIPVVMTSGRWPAAELAEKARQCGAAAYLVKADLPLSLVKAKIDALIDMEERIQSSSGADDEDLRPRGAVLLADDQDEWLMLVRHWLERCGHRVIATNDARAVLDLAVARRPECLVLDYDLGRRTADDVCRELRGHPQAKAVPVVVLTSLESGRAALDEGADQFVKKSGDDPAPLLQAVHRAIRRHRWSTGRVVNGDLALDPRDRSVYRDGMLIAQISDGQFKLLSLLVSRSPRYVGHAELCAELLGRPDDERASKALEMLVVRTKEGVGNVVGRRIHHLKGFGWLYEKPDPPPPPPKK